MRLTYLLLPSLILALPSPNNNNINYHHHLSPRQSPTPDNGSSAIANALAALFSRLTGSTGTGTAGTSGTRGTSGTGGSGTGSGASDGTVPSPYLPPADITYTDVSFSQCTDIGTSGSNVSKVLIGPCEGGSGQEGDPCVFTQGRNYTIVITYTSPVDVPINQSRTGLASYDRGQRTAYSGQSFGACSYTQCPITANVERNYTYPFRTFAAPNFQKLVFNATNGIAGESIMCARIPVNFQPTA